MTHAHYRFAETTVVYVWRTSDSGHSVASPGALAPRLQEQTRGPASVCGVRHDSVLCELLGHGVAWGVRGFAAAENDHPLFGPSLTPLPTPIDILALRRRRHRV